MPIGISTIEATRVASMKNNAVSGIQDMFLFKVFIY